MKTLSQIGIMASFCGLSLVTLSACQQQSPQYGYIEGETMGTSYHIRYDQSAAIDAETIQAKVDERLVQINDSMSTYQDNSLITKFNLLPPGQALPLDPDFISVLTMSKEVYKASQGAFDPTVMPLIETWGFGGKLSVDKLQSPPSEADIAKAKALIDFDSVQLSGDSLSKTKPGVELDFSAIAKGYGVDAIADVLAREYQINNYMVEIGGEVATSGVNEQSKPWQIAIDAPLSDSTVNSRKPIAVVRQPSRTSKQQDHMHIATSGNYRNHVIFNGVSYSHTIDPIKGVPVVNGVPSVTVAANSVALADAWATALTAMPYEQALKVADQQNIAALFVVSRLPAGEAAKTLDDWEVVETPAMQAFRGTKANK